MSDDALYPFEKLWNYADTAGTEAAFRKYLHESDLPDPHRTELLTQISRACCLQRHHREAQEALDEAPRLGSAPGGSTGAGVCESPRRGRALTEGVTAAATH